jgi:hypothetical protein
MNSLPIKETLQKALAILDDESHWTKRASARDAAGRSVDVLSGEAVSFCLIGAVSKALDTYPGVTQLSTEYQIWNVLLEAVRSKYPNHSASSFNDNPRTTLQDVHTILKVAIASKEAA